MRNFAAEIAARRLGGSSMDNIYIETVRYPARDCDWPLISYLAHSGFDVDRVPPGCSFGAIGWAVRNGQIDFLREMLECGYSIELMRSHSGTYMYEGATEKLEKFFEVEDPGHE